jgi:multidrug resistance efflux pump
MALDKVLESELTAKRPALQKVETYERAVAATAREYVNGTPPMDEAAALVAARKKHADLKPTEKERYDAIRAEGLIRRAEIRPSRALQDLKGDF